MAGQVLVLASQDMVDIRAAGCSENFGNGIQAVAHLAIRYTLASQSHLCKGKEAVGGCNDREQNLGPHKLVVEVVPHGKSESTIRHQQCASLPHSG